MKTVKDKESDSEATTGTHDTMIESLDDINAGKESKIDQKQGRKKIFIVLILMFCSIIILYHFFGKHVFTWVTNTLVELIRSKSWFTILVLLFVQFIFGWVLFLPGLAYFNIIQAMIMKDLLASWMMSFLGAYLAGISLFLIVNRYFKDSVRKRFQDFEPYQMLLEECRQNPIRDGVIFNSLFMPVSVKNFITSISGLSLQQAAIVMLPGNCILCFLCAAVGVEINDISDLLTSKSFFQKPLAQKINFLVTIGLLIATLALLLIIGLHYKRKYKEFQRRKSEVRFEHDSTLDQTL